MLLSFLLTASLVAAQAIPNAVPACAQSCLGNSIAETGCSGTDVACICKSSLIQNITPCVTGTCSSSDLQATIQFAIGFCRAAGVSITVPNISGTSSGVSRTGSASASGSARASGTTTSTSSSASASATGARSDAIKVGTAAAMVVGVFALFIVV